MIFVFILHMPETIHSQQMSSVLREVKSVFSQIWCKQLEVREIWKEALHNS